MKKTLLLVLPWLLALYGCSSHPDAIEPTPLADFEKSFEVDRVWHRHAGKGTRRGPLTLAPAVSERFVHVADVDGRLYAFDRRTGERLWRQDTGLRISALSVGYGYLLVGTRDGEAVALSVDEGEQRWKATLSSEVLAPPALNGDYVVVQTLDGRVTALDLASGTRRWMYEEVVPVLTLRGTAPPVIAEDRAWVAFASGKVVALDMATGLPLWERRVAEPSGRSELERLVDIDAHVIVENGGVFAATFQGKLAVLDQESGRPFWEKDMSTFQPMSSAASTLFVADEQGLVWGVDQRSGAALWKNDSFRGRGLTGTAIQSGLVVVGDSEGWLHWLDAIDGSQVARRMFDPDGFAAAPRVYDDLIYVLSRDGELAAYTVSPL